MATTTQKLPLHPKTNLQSALAEYPGAVTDSTVLGLAVESSDQGLFLVVTKEVEEVPSSVDAPVTEDVAETEVNTNAVETISGNAEAAA